MTEQPVAFVSFPSQYTVSALRAAFARVLPQFRVVDEFPDDSSTVQVQWCDTDELSFDVGPTQLLSSYAVRKALIRKNMLARTIAGYTAKHPDSILVKAVPRTYAVEVAHADELDGPFYSRQVMLTHTELWQDELYDLGQELDAEGSWWILKPALADRGQGIRLFDSREALEDILESFEDEESDEDDDDLIARTGVSLSSLRQFVIQRYVDRPLLLDSADRVPSNRKFHLRAYVLCIGALSVHLFHDMLALFADVEYGSPSDVDDLSAHLSNTCLQDQKLDADRNVRLLSDLVGCQKSGGAEITADDVRAVEDKIVEVLGDTFKAALGAGSHFQPLPNAFEIFGVDLLLDADLQPHLLEINAGPDFEQTGAKLRTVIDRLFEGTLRLAVAPFLKLDVGTVGDDFRCCLDVQVRKW